MSIELVTLTMFGSLIIGLILGLPLSFVLGGIAVGYTYLLWGPQALFMIVSRSFDWSTNVLILCLPYFITMGLLLERSGIAGDLYEMFYRWVGFLKGSLAIVTVVVCAVVAAMTGNTGAGTVSTGIIAYPAMIKRNYDKRLVIGTIASAGTLGILIPPSVMFIIIGMVCGVSVGKLFAGGVLSGMMLAGLFILFIVVRTFLNPKLAPPAPVAFSRAEKMKSLAGVIPPLFIIVAVLGTLFGGLATPTEAASIGVCAVAVSIAIRRRFNWRMFQDVCYTNLKLSCMVLWIIIGASCFVSLYSALGAKEFLEGLVVGLGLSRWFVIILMMLILFILGMFLDPAGIIMLAAPVFYPIIIKLGFDPIWFGVLFVINLQMGYISPPFGYNLFYMKSICGSDVRIEEIYLSVLPFLGIMAIGLAIIMVFPQLATWLPSILIKK